MLHMKIERNRMPLIDRWRCRCQSRCRCRCLPRSSLRCSSFPLSLSLSVAGSNKMKCFKFKCKVRSWPAESCERERERGRKECQTDWTAGWTAETALAETRWSGREWQGMASLTADWRKQSQNNLNDLAKITLPSSRQRHRHRHPPVTLSSFLMPKAAACCSSPHPSILPCIVGIESKLQKPNSTNAGAQFGINNEAQSTDCSATAAGLAG